MKRIFSFFLCATIALCVMSCTEDIETVQNVTLSCKTVGFHDGKSYTEAKWEAGEQIYLYRAEDWSAALMLLSTGADSNVARFNGDTAGTNKGYYAVRPSTAVGSVTLDGVAEISVEPRNIFLAEENSSLVAPQIGVGKKNGLTFESMFGALKFNVANECKVSSITAEVVSREQGLYGTFAYNLIDQSITSNQVEYAVVREFATAVDIAAASPIYVALPAGNYNNVELVVKDLKSGKNILYVAENVSVAHNTVTSLDAVSPVEMLALVGCWRAKSFGGVDANVDLYIEFGRGGEFVICQRTDSLEYSIYRGTYTVDAANSLVSGVYSDGVAWANDYRYSINEQGCLLLTNVNDATDVVTYEAAALPEAATTTSSRATVNDVRPF